MKSNLSPTLPLAAIAGLCLAVGCATQSKPRVLSSGDPIADAQLAMKAGPTNDCVLWQYRLGTLCLRAGRTAEAKEYFDQALARINGIFGKDKSAAAARSLFRAESKKTFIGEPYERAMANFYRGVLYWQDGEIDNARACFINAQFQDSDAGMSFLQPERSSKAKGVTDGKASNDAEKYASDYVLLDYLDGWTTAKQGGDGSDAFRRAAALAGERALPEFNAKAKVMVFAEYGGGPVKYATGNHKHELRFRPGATNVTSARLKMGERTWSLAPYDDINFQATTRGGRVMDHVLKDKAVFKSTTDTMGDVALAAGAGTAMTTSYTGEAGGYAALGMMAFALISKGISAAANPAADTRSWENLPAYVSFAALELPPGTHAGEVEFLDPAGAVVLAKPVTLNIPDTARDSVVFLSDRR